MEKMEKIHQKNVVKEGGSQKTFKLLVLILKIT